MKLRDIVIGVVVVILLVVLVSWYRKTRIEKSQDLVVETPTLEEKVSRSFNGFTIPDDVAKIELKDVTGGDSFGIATENMVLADLPEVPKGKYYQVWVDDKWVGNMRVAKGGYLYEGDVKGGKLSVRLDDKILLEGSF